MLTEPSPSTTWVVFKGRLAGVVVDVVAVGVVVVIGVVVSVVAIAVVVVVILVVRTARRCRLASVVTALMPSKPARCKLLPKTAASIHGLIALNTPSALFQALPT
jgi:hypothetical protein